MKVQCVQYQKLLSFLLAIVLLTFSGCQSQKIIVNGLTERDANEILVFLASKNIHADKVPSAAGKGFR